MKILGIETSCDETAAAVVENGKHILSSVILSSLDEHKKYGGIVPEIASRRQLELINIVIEKALSDAKIKLKYIDAIAVTKEPGLIGSLLVGISFARALSYAIKKPYIEVNHIKAHLYANFINFGKEKLNTPKLPAVGLIVSGGHTSLYYIKNFNNFLLLGHTLDDVAGEAFDKVARILDLGYPGGPIIDKLASKVTSSEIKFTPAQLPESLNFSFSGVKTAVLYYKNKHFKDPNFSIEKIAFGFQNSIIQSLVEKSLTACQKTKAKILVVGGGVAANSGLRKKLTARCHNQKIRVYFPPMSLCIDNAAMIAGLGYHN